MNSTPFAPSVLLSSALRDLGFAARETIESTAAAVDSFVESGYCADSLEKAAAQGLAAALRSGDAERIERAARAVVDPSVAMATMLAEVNAEAAAKAATSAAPAAVKSGRRPRARKVVAPVTKAVA